MPLNFILDLLNELLEVWGRVESDSDALFFQATFAAPLDLAVFFRTSDLDFIKGILPHGLILTFSGPRSLRRRAQRLSDSSNRVARLYALGRHESVLSKQVLLTQFAIR